MSPFKATYGFDPPVDWSTEIIPESSPTLHCYLLGLRNSIFHLNLELEHIKDTGEHFADGEHYH